MDDTIDHEYRQNDLERYVWGITHHFRLSVDLQIYEKEKKRLRALVLIKGLISNKNGIKIVLKLVSYLLLLRERERQKRGNFRNPLEIGQICRSARYNGKWRAENCYMSKWHLFGIWRDFRIVEKRDNSAWCDEIKWFTAFHLRSVLSLSLSLSFAVRFAI